MLKEGNKVRVTVFSGKELTEPIEGYVGGIWQASTGRYVANVQTDEGEIYSIYTDEPLWDTYEVIRNPEVMITPKVGDYILVTSYEGVELDAPHLSRVQWADVSLGGEYIISLSYVIPGLPTILTLNDLEWEFGEDAEEYQGTSPVSSEDDYPIPPSYAELASQGMTISEYAGEEMSAETLKFKPSEDIVTEPSHYNQGKFETIEMIQEITNGYKVGYVAHCVGTAVKYLSRAPFKGTLLTDLKKARQYITFAIEYLEGER